MYSDAAYAVFRDGYSSSGYMFSVGVSNAPFYAVAKAQTEVATCPMTAEYYAASAACKELAYLCQVAYFLGWEAWALVIFHLDCKMLSSLSRLHKCLSSLGILSKLIITFARSICSVRSWLSMFRLRRCVLIFRLSIYLVLSTFVLEPVFSIVVAMYPLLDCLCGRQSGYVNVDRRVRTLVGGPD